MAPPKNWESVRQFIFEHYTEQGKPLPEVMADAKVRFKFEASTRMFRAKIRKWGFKKQGPLRQPESDNQSDMGDSGQQPTSADLMFLHELPFGDLGSGLEEFDDYLFGFWDSYEDAVDAPIVGDSTSLPVGNSPDGDGLTCLPHAVMTGSHHDVVQCLSSGAQVDIPFVDDDQLVLYAAARSDRRSVKALLRRGADINAKSREGKTLLHFCLDWPEMVGMLLERSPEVSCQDDNGDTPLHLAMALPIYNRIVIEKLIQAGANVNRRNRDLITPFHMALESQFLKGEDYAYMVTMFLQNGADIHSPTRDGRLPFEIFVKDPVQSENVLLMNLFLYHRADLNVILRSGNILINDILAKASGNPQKYFNLARNFCCSADLSMTGTAGASPLHYVLQNYPPSTGFLELVKIMLTRNADPNKTDRARRAPLILLLNRLKKDYNFYFVEAVKALLSHGANPRCDGPSGSPLDLAIHQFRGSPRDELLGLFCYAPVSSGNPHHLFGVGNQPNIQQWAAYRDLYQRPRFNPWTTPYRVAPQTPYHVAPQTPYHVAPQPPYHVAPQTPYHVAPQTISDDWVDWADWADLIDWSGDFGFE